VFRAPKSALEGTEVMPDKRGYSFDGCSPALLKNAQVRNQRIVFPGGGSYRVLELPDVETMTPELLSKIAELVKAGATVVGNPPSKSPSLVNYPDCDRQVQSLAAELWGKNLVIRTKAALTTTQNAAGQFSTELFSPYESTAALLLKLGVHSDFSASGGIRYNHRSLPDREIYFISNRTSHPVEDLCVFRDGTLVAELWDAVTGTIRPLGNLNKTAAGISMKVRLDASQSCFVVFYKSGQPGKTRDQNDFPETKSLKSLNGAWSVAFDPAWGGPEKVLFDSLVDWTARPEEGIRFYSGIATYSKTFDMPGSWQLAKGSSCILDLGKVNHMARVKLNGHDLGVIWTSPWQVDISRDLKQKGNMLEIEVANLWINRLIGDESKPDDGIKDRKWPEWLLNGTARTSGRYTFTTHRYYKKDSPLVESGLIGPVRILVK
jgi:hypothetical protein